MDFAYVFEIRKFNFAIPVERFNGFWLKIVDEIAWSLVIFADSERAIGFVFSVVKNLSF